MSQGFPGQGNWPAQGGWGRQHDQGFSAQAGFPQQGNPPPAFGPSGSGPRGFGQQGFGQPGFGGPGWPAQPPQQQVPGRPPRRSLKPLIIGALAVVGLVIAGLIAYSLLSAPRYENDDYVPPSAEVEVPLPDAQVSEVEALLTANAVYAQTVPEPVRCEPANPNLDVPNATDDEVQAYIEDIVACSMRVWDPAFRGSNRWELPRPKANVYGESVTTPCGTSGPNGLYCAANQQIYFSRNVPAWQDPLIIDDVITHEFGHHVQARTLVLVATAYSQRQVDRDTALELNRRIELQADCFEGLIIRSIARSRDYSPQQIEAIRNSIHDGGDDTIAEQLGREVERGHGTSAARVYWWSRGINSSDVGQCNTFIAPSHEVP